MCNFVTEFEAYNFGNTGNVLKRGGGDYFGISLMRAELLKHHYNSFLQLPHKLEQWRHILEVASFSSSRVAHYTIRWFSVGPFLRLELAKWAVKWANKERKQFETVSVAFIRTSNGSFFLKVPRVPKVQKFDCKWFWFGGVEIRVGQCNFFDPL